MAKIDFRLVQDSIKNFKEEKQNSKELLNEEKPMTLEEWHEKRRPRLEELNKIMENTPILSPAHEAAFKEMTEMASEFIKVCKANREA